MEADPVDNSSGPPMAAPPEDRPGFSEPVSFPVWSGRDLVGIVVVLFIALFMADSFALLIASSVPGLSRDAQGLASGPSGCGSGAGRRLSGDGGIHRQSDQAASQPLAGGGSLAFSKQMADVSFRRHDSGRSGPGAVGKTADSEADAD